MNEGQQRLQLVNGSAGAKAWRGLADEDGDHEEIHDGIEVPKRLLMRPLITAFGTASTCMVS